MAHFNERVLYVVFHLEVCFAVFMDQSVVPFDVNAGIFCAFPIHGNLVVFFECHLEVTSVALSEVFQPKIINK